MDEDVTHTRPDISWNLELMLSFGRVALSCTMDEDVTHTRPDISWTLSCVELWSCGSIVQDGRGRDAHASGHQLEPGVDVELWSCGSIVHDGRGRDAHASGHQLDPGGDETEEHCPRTGLELESCGPGPGQSREWYSWEQIAVYTVTLQY
ncbi:hypothetical protein J6590_027930 [Homalodisca vitripennis]|nr:hypothetical protein J6590_027930 [Homalodisca vitripennis]